MNRFLISACVMMTFIGMSYGVPTRSMLAARNVVNASSAKEQYTAQDYILDGLIAMYDAKENAGWGVHDNAKRLRNLVGNDEIILDSSCVIGPKTVSWITTETNKWGGVSDSLDDLPLQGSQTTTECVYSGATGGGWSAIRTIYSYRNGAGGIYNSRTCILFGIYRNSATSYGYGQLWFETPINPFVQTSNSVNSWNDYSMYVNGMKVASKGGPTSLTKVEDNKVYILKSWKVGEQLIFGTLRIYNRSLTEEEIAYNYMIDKSRFNLP